MTQLQSPLVWLFVVGSGYLVLLLFWARTASGQSSAVERFLKPVRSVSPFIVAVALGAASFAPFVAMNMADSVATQGFGFAAISLGGVMVPLTGALFFKRIWALTLRFGSANQADFFDQFYGSKVLVVLSAAVALLFAVALGGLLLAQLASLFHALSGGSFSPFYSMALISLILTVYSVIGGMRGVLYVGAIQGVLGAAGLIGLLVYVIFLAGGFGSFLAGLETAQKAAGNGQFGVSGVIQFTRGLGIETPAGGPWTAMMVFSTVIGFLGLQASPVMHQFAISARSTRGLAGTQTWVSAAIFGGLAVALAIVVGGYGLVHADANVMLTALKQLAVQSPWFMAAAYFCLLSLIFVFVAAGHLSAANILVLEIYRRNFHRGLTDETAVVLVRIVIILLIILSVLMASSLPVATASLASLCLPLSLQFLPSLLGICFMRGITRQAATTGVVIGMICVLLTEDAGRWALHFIGLDLPWGRWPWTLHSALWGICFNLLTVLVISVITQQSEQGRMWRAKNAFISETLQGSARVHALRPTAWSVVLAWLFLAVGPGLVMGNTAFVRLSADHVENMMGAPSLPVWIVIGWALGVIMIWFLSYRMELATPLAARVTPIETTYEMPERGLEMNTARLGKLFWILLAIGGGISLLAWIFGK